MPKLVNRAKMTTATTGTGTITLGSAVDGYQTFADAGVANGNIVRYAIEDGNAWEIGLGTYSSTGTTLTRGTIESSTGTAINLSGNATVFVTAAAGDLQELVTFAETFALPTADGTNGQVLTTNGSGTLTFSTISGYTNADVDAHLNTSTAASGEVLSWTGTDYDWITAPAALTGETNSASPFETSLGSGAGAVNTGANNTFIGFEAGNDNTTGEGNVAVGYQSFSTNTSGSGNTVIGAGASSTPETATFAVAVGRLAVSAASSVSVGYAAGLSGSGSQSVAVGAEAGRNNKALGNIGVGWRAGRGSSTGGLTGSNNVSIGRAAGQGLSTGGGNFLGGPNSGLSLTTGSNNVAIGNGALDAATTGGTNIAIGQDAMGAGVASFANAQNVAIGSEAGLNITSAFANVYLGFRAGRDATTGSSNVAVGYEAGRSLTTGEFNTLVGFRAGLPGQVSNLTTGSNNTLIGFDAAASSATVSNEITLGNSSIAALRCQVTTITSLSDARDKTDIQPLNAGLEFIEALNPVSFTWNMRDGGKVGIADTGFIAQDLQMAQEWAGVTIPGLVYDVNPDKLEAGYGKLIPVLVQAIKDLSAKVNLLEAQLEAK